MLVLALFGFMLILMLMRVGLFFGSKAEGRTVGEIQLSFKERLLYHRTNVYAIGAVLLLMTLAGKVSGPIEIVVIFATFAIITIPVKYVVTTEGIGLNNVLFRRWEEFRGMMVAKRHVSLVPTAEWRGMRLFITPDVHHKDVALIRRFLPKISEEKTPRKPVNKLKLAKYASLAIVPIMVAAFALGSGVTHAQDPTDDGPHADRSGIETGADGCAGLTGIAPGTITADDCTAASTSEPFASQLSVLVNQNRLASNFMWVLVTGYLVMFMQAGFALVEVGFCRAKSAMHVMMTNFMIYGIGMLGYFICGFALQFGGIGNVGVGSLGGLATLNKEATISIDGIHWGLFGYKGFFLIGPGYDVGVAVMFLFQMVFMDTTATIPTGAMAERWKWSAFCVYGFFIGGFLYPIYGNWVWGGGWLSQLGNEGMGAGYLDFAGSGVVHAIGGWTALAGAMVLGPRIGKYNKDGSVNAIPGHNIILAAVGTFILAFGWFGFNPGSTLGASGNGSLRIGLIAVNTMLAGAAGSFTAMCYTWAVGKKPDPGMMINGLLAGLVAITAPSGWVSPYYSVLIGGIAGVLVVLSVGFFDRVLKIDDPVGAISVHGVNGMWGQLALGLFADGSANYGGLQAKGLFFGDFGQFEAQVVGAVVAFVWAFGVAWLFFKGLDMIMGIRSKPEDEINGLDIPEMGLPAYSPDAEPYRGGQDFVPGSA
ncbi:MAG: ammonium transporter [Chloroflexota bacterium]